MLDKTFETMPFEDFKDFFGKEFGNTHRDYLFDLYSSYISTTRSNSEEVRAVRSAVSASKCGHMASAYWRARVCMRAYEQEFGVVIFQADLEDKLAR
jgi:hypothetical protein